MSLLEGLRFSRGDSPIHKLDPRVKFIMTLLIFTSAIFFIDLIPLLIIFFIHVPIIIIGKIQKEWLKSLRGAIFLGTIIFVTNLLSFYFFQGRKITLQNIEYSISLVIRFLVLVTSFSIFFLTTSPDKLSLALEKARIPFEFNFAFITSIRFVPVLADEAQSIMDAQRSRGLELDKGNIINRVKNYVPILLPLIINSIRRSLELAEAMESRAFGAIKKRTNLYELKMSHVDYAVLSILLVSFFIAVYLRLYHPRFGSLFSAL